MRHARKIVTVGALVLLCFSSAQAGLIFTNLFKFVAADGAYPVAGLIQAGDGNFYGTAYEGGASGNPGFGTVFRVSPLGSFSNLLSFDNTNGANPYGGLVQGTNGNFYGTTEQGGTNGGYGTILEMTPAGALTTLLSFNNINGAFPEAALAPRLDGNFYGTTSAGGTNGGYGTVFRISPSGGFTSLFSFNNTNGSTPYAALIPGTNGNFYGTTLAGGTNGGFGTVFEITPAGSLTTLHSFDNTNGASPYGALTLAADANFYGTASAGGASNNGTLFRMNSHGSFATLFAFSGADGAGPYGSLIQCADGSFYGTTELGGTNSDGSVFKWTPAGGLVPLISFDYTSNGAFPLAGLIQGADGNLYGVTHGGTANGKGGVFKMSVPIAPVFTASTASAGLMSLSWTAVAGQNYQLQFLADLNQNIWTNLGPSVLATNGMMSASDPVPSGPSQRYYRVTLLP